MKLESDKDFKQAADFIGAVKKLKNLDGLSIQDSYLVIFGLEWMVKAMSDYKQSLNTPAAAPLEEPIKPSSALPVKNKKSK